MIVSFLDILLKRYENKSVEDFLVNEQINRELFQPIVTKWINEWFNRNEDTERNAILKERLELNKNNYNEPFRKRMFNALWLNYAPKFTW